MKGPDNLKGLIITCGMLAWIIFDWLMIYFEEMCIFFLSFCNHDTYNNFSLWFVITFIIQRNIIMIIIKWCYYYLNDDELNSNIFFKFIYFLYSIAPLYLNDVWI